MDKITKNLINYKNNILKISEEGEFKGNKYQHILPIEDRKNNIISVYRDDFWKYIENNQINLHKYFHHLNSSQALCFNLFYPFISSNSGDILLKSLNIFEESVKIKSAEFEKVLHKNENTNFDFLISLTSRDIIFFEIKYTENSFGKARNDSKHIEKKDLIYDKVFNYKEKIQKQYHQDESFFENYQLIRNIVYLNFNRNDNLFLIFPKEKTEFKNQIESIPVPELKNKIHIIYLEDLTEEIINNSSNNSKLLEHFIEFKNKYLPE
jgi:hypothetical protein